MTTKSFFERPEDHSTVKARIVANYFAAWASVIGGSIGPQKKMSYIDLFAGRGRYEDGTESTPLLVLDKAINNPPIHKKVRERLEIRFNDSDPEIANRLRAEVNSFPGVERLRIPPRVDNVRVDESIAKEFEACEQAPSLIFLDPFGYKGITLRLLQSMIKDWGCDCILFFNYLRINAALDNRIPGFRANMEALFGKAQLDELRERLDAARGVSEREDLVLQAVHGLCSKMAAGFVVPFRFRNYERTTHHLILLTKNPKGFHMMKEIMGKESSWSEQGVPSFEFVPQPPLPGLEKPLDALQAELMAEFAGQTLSMAVIHRQHAERHVVGRLYIRSNYKDALACLEKAGRIKATPSAVDRPKNKNIKFPDTVLVTFPPKA